MKQYTTPPAEFLTMLQASLTKGLQPPKPEPARRLILVLVESRDFIVAYEVPLFPDRPFWLDNPYQKYPKHGHFGVWQLEDVRHMLLSKGNYVGISY
jgi:hypothetical protein